MICFSDELYIKDLEFKRMQILHKLTYDTGEDNTTLFQQLVDIEDELKSMRRGAY